MTAVQVDDVGVAEVGDLPLLSGERKRPVAEQTERRYGRQEAGRQDRLTEPAPGSMDELAGAVAEALRTDRPDRDHVLFGHSMGASVAWETALRLEPTGVGPRHVFVSGRPGPRRQRPGTVHLRMGASSSPRPGGFPGASVAGRASGGRRE